MTGHDWVQIAQAAAWAIGAPASIWAVRPIVIRIVDFLDNL